MSEPITTALRGLLCARPLGDPCWDAMDAVDAVHAALERENAELRERVAVLDNVGGSMHDGGRITDELREYATVSWDPWPEARDRLLQMCDRIDVEHESACKKERGEGIRIAEEAAMEEMAEYGLVRKNKEHAISHATVEVIPHIDWSRMADELDEFAQKVRDMVGDAE